MDMAGIESVTPATTAPLANDTSAKTNRGQDQKNQFLQLLVAQLKGQNPLDPLDGTQFISQLAQFTSVEELIGIHTAIDALNKNLQPAAQNAPAPFQSKS
jgi:flagellar basal-body rod modification protein FlgD